MSGLKYRDMNTNIQRREYLREKFFVYAGVGSIFLIVLGLLLDFCFGNQIFQRFGAVVVGIAVLHGLQLMPMMKIEAAMQSLNVSVDNLVRTRGFDSMEDLIGDETAVSAVRNVALQRVTNKGFPGFSMPDDQDERAAKEEMIADLSVRAMIQAKSDLSQHRSRIDKLAAREIMIGFAGTLIWAFGDWVTNLLFHCGQIACAS
jgi:hypothetical protein